MVLSSEVMRVSIRWLCVALAAAALGGGAAAGGACERGRSWWDRQRGACQPCTRCAAARRLAVLFPCELHRDTVCHSLDDVRLSLDPPDADQQYYDYADYDSDVEPTQNDEAAWDFQTPSLVIAISGCAVFFLVVLVLSLYHAKQWRILKQALKSDVQDLTAKLKLMESGGEAPMETVVASDHHIYCNIHAGKEALLGPNSAKKFGNVYTQEKHPT